MTIQMIEARHCTLSRLNVRKVPSEPALLAQLMADIEARGVLQNLIGVPTPKKSGKYEVIAGGRRLTCVKQLIADGKLPANTCVPMLVMDARDQAAEVSLAENLQREAMNPADACLAFRHCIEVEGASIEDVARRFGVTTRFIEGRLRLGQLAPVVFEALRNGEISLDIAKAYGVTGDHTRQEQVFEQASRFNHGASSIRRMMIDDTISPGDRLARLVGRDAYLAAGGRVEADLFGDIGEVWVDASIVIKLAEEKMAAVAASTAGFGAVVPVLGARPDYELTRDLMAVQSQRVPLTDDEQARAETIEAELEALQLAHDEADDAATEEAIATQFDLLEEELGSLRNRTAEPDPATKAEATAFLVVNESGDIAVHPTLYVPRPAGKPKPAVTGAPGEDAAEDTEDDQGPALSRSLADELAVQRRDLLAVHIAHDPGVALDLMIFVLADAATRSTYGAQGGVNIMARPNGRGAHDFRTKGAIADEMARLHEKLNQSWIGHSDISHRFTAFCELTDEERGAWAGWVVAHSLDATLRDERSAAFHNHLGALLGIDVAAWWRPTAENFFGRVKKGAILGVLDAIGGPELRSRYASAKKTELAVAAEKICGGTAIIEPQIKAAAIAWVPDVMRFDSQSGDADSDPAADLLESSEAECTSDGDDGEPDELPEDASEAEAA